MIPATAGAPSAVTAGQQVQHQRLLDDLDPGVGLDRGDQRALDLRPGRVAAGVGDPVAVVPALARQGEPPGRVEVELRAALDQHRHLGRALPDEHVDGRRLAEPGPGDEGVGDVLGHRVSLGLDRGDAALGPAGRAGGHDVLGHHHDQGVRAHPLAALERGGQAGDPGADDDDVDLADPARGLRGEPARERRPGQRGQQRLLGVVRGDNTFGALVVELGRRRQHGPMVSHGWSGGRPTSDPRTPGPWRPWRDAWLDAAYGPHGFWSTQQPGDHFRTGVAVGPLVAEAVAGLLPPGCAVVVDVGAGDGLLLGALVDRLPGVALVGVDRRGRPPGLDDRVGWVEDHWDVGVGRWVAGGPHRWTGDAGAPLLVAHEWLDDLPVDVVERAAGGWHAVEVDPVGRERLGARVGPDDEAWLARWWAEVPRPGARAEVGRPRDVAWAALVRAAADRGGRALAVDYGHRRAERPADGTFLAYGDGRRRAPVPDGSVNLTAGVAVDALVAAGEAGAATTLLLQRQSERLGRPAPAAARPDDPLADLVGRSERAALTDPGRWGDLWWLLQGPAGSAPLA